MKTKSIFKIYILVCLIFFLSIEIISNGNIISLHNLIKSNNIFISLYLFIFFLFTSLYVFIFKKPLLALCFHYSVWIVLAFISSINLYFKGTPIIFEDLFLVSEATDIASKYINSTVIINAIITIIFLIFITALCYKLSNNYTIKMFKTKKILLNIIFSFLFICAYIFSLDKLYNFGKSITYTLSDFNLNETYNKNGFMYSFYGSAYLYTSTNLDFNYDADGVINIKNKLSTSDKTRDFDKNIILIQLESFFDPLKLNNVTYSEDPIKNFRSLSKNNQSGEIIVPVIGGGTIQTEFEMLTGINIKNLYTKMPYLNLLNNTEVESIAHILNSYGLTPSSFHNYFSTFYNRTKAYKNLGFTTFVPLETMVNKDRGKNFWYKDNILIDEMINKIKDTNGKDFIFGVTVESHGPYNTLIDGNIKVRSDSLSSKDIIELQNYVNILKDVDEFILNLKSSLDSLKEDYILILYGDHLPSLGENKSTLSSLSEEDLFKAPYLIIESNNNKSIKIEKDTLYSYELMNEVLKDLDITPTIYHRFRDEFKGDPNINYYENQLLLDIKRGRKNIYDNKQFPYENENINLGVKNPKITNVKYKDNKILLIGDYFTENSKIYINGKKVNAKYISRNEIDLLNNSLSENDEIVCVTFSNKNSPLNISNIFKFQRKDSLK